MGFGIRLVLSALSFLISVGGFAGSEFAELAGIAAGTAAVGGSPASAAVSSFAAMPLDRLTATDLVAQGFANGLNANAQQMQDIARQLDEAGATLLECHTTMPIGGCEKEQKAVEELQAELNKLADRQTWLQDGADSAQLSAAALRSTDTPGEVGGTPATAGGEGGAGSSSGKSSQSSDDSMLPMLAAMSGGQKGGEEEGNSESNSRSQDASQQTSEQQKQIDALKSQLADTGRAAQSSPKPDSGTTGLEEQITNAIASYQNSSTRQSSAPTTDISSAQVPKSQLADAQIEMLQEQIKRLREENDLAARQNRVVVEKTLPKTGDVVESSDTIASQKRSIRGLGGASSSSQPVSKLLSSI